MMDSLLRPGEMMRVITPSKKDIEGWSYSGTQESPEYFEVNGFQIPLLKDEEVYVSTQALAIDVIEANIERFLGLPATQHLPGVQANISTSEEMRRIHITKEAYDKTTAYAELMGVLFSPIPEVAMHLLRHEQAPKGLITDVVACQNQRVTTSSCRFTEYLGFLYGHEDKYYSGWCHSHAVMEAFHSPVDDRNVKRSVRTGSGLRAKFSLDDYLVSINYLPSLVVNAVGGKPFGVVGISYFSPKAESDVSFLRDVPIEFNDRTYGIDCDEDHLKEQLLEYVTVT